MAQNFPDATLDFFVDRDRSGYTFDQREAYRQLRPLLLSGEYQVLIVKDFSRFSRRNSLGLFELETLRDAHVRIISVGDAIDYPTKDEWMLIQFKFLMMSSPSPTPAARSSRSLPTVKRRANGSVPSPMATASPIPRR